MHAQILGYFWDLASLSSQEREASANKLVDLIVASQNDGTESSRSAEMSPGHALAHCSPLMQYSVKRLCRGLGSGRAGARQGFSLALTLLLQESSCLTASDVMTVLESTLDAPVSLKGAELRDLLLGQVFGYAALIRSGVDISNIASKLADALVNLLKRKVFLREAAADVLLSLLEPLDKKEMSRLLESAAELEDWLQTPAEDATAETLLVVLRLWKNLPEGNAIPLLSKDPMKFFTQEHLERVQPLLETTSNSNPRLHAVWPTVLEILIPNFGNFEKAQSPPASALEQFWNVCVENGLFKSNSHEKKALGMSLMGLLLPNIKTPEHALLIMTPNVLRSISNNAAKDSSYLHASAKRCIDTIKTYIDSIDEKYRPSISIMLRRCGGAFLEHAWVPEGITIKADASAESSEAYAQQLQEAFVKAIRPGMEGDSDAFDSRKLVLEQLSGLLKRPATSAETKKDILRFLSVFAFVVLPPPKKTFKEFPVLRAAKDCVEASKGIRQLCAARLITHVDALTRPPPHLKGKDKGTVESVSIDYLGGLLSFIDSLRKENVALVSTASTEMIDTLSKLRTTIASALSQQTTKDSRLRALYKLSALLELYALSEFSDGGDERAFEEDIAEDLSAVYAASSTAGAPKESATLEMGVPHWADTLVDVLLSLLARPSNTLPCAPIRDAAEVTFRVFCSDLTATGLEDMLRIMRRPLSGPAESEEEEEEDEEEDEIPSTDNNTDEEGGEEEEEDVAFDVEVDGDDDGEGATDADMFKMDEKLASYFSVLKDGRGGGSKAQKDELLNFKMRVAALIDSYIRKCPSSRLLPLAVEPLLTSLEAASKIGSGDTALADRIAGILRRLCKTHAETHAEESVEGIEMEVHLRRSLQLASRCADKRLSSVASEAYVYVQRVCAAGDLPVGQSSARVALEDFFEKKRSRLSRGFFEVLYRRVPALARNAVHTILSKAIAGRTDYLKGEAVLLLNALLKSADEDILKELANKGVLVGEFLVTYVSGAASKVQRSVEGVKACCLLVEQIQTNYGGGIKAVIGQEALKKLLVEMENSPLSNNGKVEGQLKQLTAMLKSTPKRKGILAGEKQAKRKKEIRQ